MLLDLLARQHAARVQHEHLQQIELARGQLHRLVAAPHLARGGVERHLAQHQAGSGHAVRAAHQRAQARRQFAQIDGLDDVVVGAAVQALDARVDGIARGQHQHRRAHALGANGGQRVQPVLARQAQIEHRRLVLSRQQLALGGDAIAHPVDRKAMLAQTRLQARAEQFVVFSQQHAHGRSQSSSSWCDCAV